MEQNAIMLIKCDTTSGTFQDRIDRIKERFNELYTLEYTTEISKEMEACRQELYILRGCQQFAQ